MAQRPDPHGGEPARRDAIPGEGVDRGLGAPLGELEVIFPVVPQAAAPGLRYLGAGSTDTAIASV
jgi:hypothetical protein